MIWRVLISLVAGVAGAVALDEFIGLKGRHWADYLSVVLLPAAVFTMVVYEVLDELVCWLEDRPR